MLCLTMEWAIGVHVENMSLRELTESLGYYWCSWNFGICCIRPFRLGQTVGLFWRLPAVDHMAAIESRFRVVVFAGGRVLECLSLT